MKKLLAILLASLMLTALFVGCTPQTPDSSSTPPSGSTGGTSSGGSSTPTPSAPPSTPAPKIRDLARYPIGGEITTFIGGDNISTNNTIPIGMIHDQFITHRPDGSFRPALITEWEASEDGMQYTFKIRKGVKWHDGQPFTAEDLAWSINLLQAGTNVIATFGAHVSHGEAIDDETVIMHMKEPYSPVLSVMGRDGYVYSKHHFEVTCKGDKNVFQMSPCGTGPYKYVKYQGGAGLTLVANEEYWDDRVRENIIPNAELRIITDTNAIQAAMETDSLDFAGIAIGVPDTSYDTFRANKEFLVTAGGSTMTWFMSMNCQVWDNQKVRQAMAHALDREFLIEIMDAGYGEVANTLAGKKSFGWTDQKPYDYDVEKAKALMKEAGHENGAGLPRMQIVVRPDRKTGGEAVQAMWSEIGIDGYVDVQEATTYLSELRKGNYGSSVISQTVSLDMGGNINTFSDPALGANRTFWYDPNVWDLLVQANRIVDPAARMELYTEAFTAIREACNEIYMFYDTKIYVHRANLALGSTYVNPPALRFYECTWLPEGEIMPTYVPDQMGPNG